MTHTVFNALIWTHHITSRRKLAVAKTAAKRWNCFVLMRTGGTPGIMYVEGGSHRAVVNWVDTIHRLRYKDYHLIASVRDQIASGEVNPGVLEEVKTVSEFGARMEEKGLTDWWRKAMGFVND